MNKNVVLFLAVAVAVTALVSSSYGAYAALVRQTVAVDAGVTVTLVGAKVSPIAPVRALSGLPFEVLIQADGVPDLGGAEVTLSFDPSLLTFLDARLSNDLSGCFDVSNAVAGSLSLVLGCVPGVSGAPLNLWIIDFQAAAIVTTTVTDLTVTTILLSDSQLGDPQVIPSEGGADSVEIIVGVCGDLNGDDKVNVFDAIIELQIIVGLIEATPAQMKLGDVVRDGVINVFDVILTLQKIVGLTEIDDCGPPDAASS